MATPVAGYFNTETGKQWELQRHVPPGKDGEFVVVSTLRPNRATSPVARALASTKTHGISRALAEEIHAAMPVGDRESWWWDRFFSYPG